MLRAHIYVQGDDDTQEEECVSIAVELGLTVTEVVRDVSNRNGYARLLGVIRNRETDAVIAVEFDHISTEIAELSSFLVLCRLHDVTTITRQGQI